MLTFEHDGYAERGWCRLEQLLASRFMFADHQLLINADYVNAWPETGQKREWVLEDPATGKLSVEKDRKVLRQLTQLANNFDSIHLDACVNDIYPDTRQNGFSQGTALTVHDLT
jgi:hypothetical protein